MIYGISIILFEVESVHISLVGFLTLIIGFYNVMLLKFKRLFYIFIFSIPFTASGIFLFDRVNRKTGITITMFLSILLFLGVLLNYRQGYRIKKRTLRLILLLFLFLASAYISTFLIPLIINGRAKGYNQYGFISPIYLTSFNLTQFIYLVYGGLTILVIIFYVKKREELVNSIRTFILSGLFVSIWGWYQYLASLFGFQYINIFNTINEGYKQTINNIPRLVSVALEPSNISIYMIFLIILTYMLKDNKIIFKKRDHMLLIIIFIITLLMTLSTTALLILFCFFSFIIINKIYVKHNLSEIVINKSLIYIIFSLIICCILTIYILNKYYIEIYETILSLTINKISTASGNDRFTRAIYSFELFFNYPIFGVGWGSNETYDSLTKLLSNLGIIGFSLFSFIILEIHRFKHTIKDELCFNIYNALDIGNIIYFIVSLFSGLNFTSPILWSIWGFIFAIINIDYNS
jgi:hypothetical protein